MIKQIRYCKYPNAKKLWVMDDNGLRTFARISIEEIFKQKG